MPFRCSDIITYILDNLLPISSKPVAIMLVKYYPYSVLFYQTPGNWSFPTG